MRTLSIELSGNRLTLHRITPSSREYMLTSNEMFGLPGANSEAAEMEDASGGHRAVYRDLLAAI